MPRTGSLPDWVAVGNLADAPGMEVRTVVARDRMTRCAAAVSGRRGDWKWDVSSRDFSRTPPPRRELASGRAATKLDAMREAEAALRRCALED